MTVEEIEGTPINVNMKLSPQNDHLTVTLEEMDFKPIGDNELKSTMVRNPITGDGIVSLDCYTRNKPIFKNAARNPITGEGIAVNVGFGAQKQKRPNPSLTIDSTIFGSNQNQ